MKTQTIKQLEKEAKCERQQMIRQLEQEQAENCQRLMKDKYNQFLKPSARKPWWKRLLFGSVAFWAITGFATTIIVNEYGQMIGKLDWPKDKVLVVVVPTGMRVPQVPATTPIPAATPRP